MGRERRWRTDGVFRDRTEAGELLAEALGGRDAGRCVVAADHGSAFDPELPFRGIVGQPIGRELAADVIWLHRHSRERNP